jgi:hypothetical protein
MSKQRKIPTPAWDRHGGAPGGISASRGRYYAMLGVIGLVVVAIGVIGVGFVLDWVEDQQRPGSTAVKVGERTYTVRDMTARARLLAGETGSTQASAIIPTVTAAAIDEAILLQYASEMKVEATDPEIKEEIAKMMGIKADDPNFDSLYQQELDTVDLSEEEYRNYARGRVLDAKMTKKFEEEVPAETESIPYASIQVTDQQTADQIMEQLDAGGDFAALAKEFSTDTTTKDKGGDKGWLPRGGLTEAQEDVLFSLKKGETAMYPAPAGGVIFIYKALGNPASHAVSDEWKPTLAASAYSDWKKEKQDSLTVVDELSFTDGDGDKIKYVIDNADLTSGT